MEDKTFVVYFHGKLDVDAVNEEEAKESAYDTLNESGASFSIDSVDMDE